jgi:hypothetical protein
VARPTPENSLEIQLDQTPKDCCGPVCAVDVPGSVPMNADAGLERGSGAGVRGASDDGPRTGSRGRTSGGPAGLGLPDFKSSEPIRTPWESRISSGGFVCLVCSRGLVSGGYGVGGHTAGHIHEPGACVQKRRSFWSPLPIANRAKPATSSIIEGGTYRT